MSSNKTRTRNHGDCREPYNHDELARQVRLSQDIDQFYRQLAVRRVFTHLALDQVEAVRLAASLATDLNGNIPNAVYEFLDSPHTKQDQLD